LLSLNKTELVDAMPPDWDAASFSFSAFSPGFRYAPLLLVDGTEAVPADYLSAYRRPHPRSPMAQGATLLVGVTREEIDFAPGDDVRAWTEDRFSDFVRAQLRPSFGDSFAERVLTAYGIGGTGRTTARPLQQAYAQIVSDATIYCPSLVLADAYAAGVAARRPAAAGRLYVYSTSQQPGNAAGFCPLMPFQSIQGYCPRYAFHAADLFALLAPDWEALARAGRGPGYNRTSEDEAYGELLARRFAELAATGGVAAWREYRGHDGLDKGYSVVDLAAPGEVNIANLRQHQCELWKPFYDKLGLIN